MSSIEAEVRPGLAGHWDRFVGPGASITAQAGTTAAVIAGASFGDAGLAPGAPLVQRAVMRLVAVDLWGGVWVNNTPSCVRWYERPGQGFRQHLGFSALHIMHPALIAGVDLVSGARNRGSAARWALGHYAWMMASTTVVAQVPRRTRLPIAAAATVASILLDKKLGRSKAAPWFAPVFSVKLLIGHAAGSIWNAKR